MSLFSLNKKQRLKNKREINRLYSNGDRIVEFPLILVWETVEANNEYLKIALSVPKKCIPNAVNRNQIKRLLRESFRVQKSILFNKLKANNNSVNILIIYAHSKILSYSEIHAKINVTLQRLSTQL